jgi:glycerol-3-phosphate dehydrogenase subunit B
MFDVVIIGGGLSGSIAALSAHHRGARVALANRSWGATALSTGALDIAYTPALSRTHLVPRTIAEHIMDIVAHRRRHPYSVLGLERSIMGIRRGFEALSRDLEPAGLLPATLDLEAENLSLPSSLGVLVAAGSALAPHLGADFSAPTRSRIGVLEIKGLAYFDARRVAAGLARDARTLNGTAPEVVVVPLGSQTTTSPLALARCLDDQQHVDSLARELNGKTAGLDLLIAPPILGLERHGAARQRFAEAAGVAVVEAVAHMPSVPGVRLQRALDLAVAGAGIEIVGEVVNARCEGGRVRAVVTKDRQELEAGAFVLATGRFVAGGVTWRNDCRETLFGLPVGSDEGVLDADSPDAAVRETPMESHPLMTAGVQVGATLQPLADGRVAFENLYAAGMVIGGFASRYVLCADGVAMSTGFLAGEAAVYRAGALA